MKRYPYVGPHDILRHALKEPAGMPVRSAADLEDWLRRTGQKPNRLGQFVLTFVIDEATALRVADRGSEHVACAGGRPVLSAGELFVALAGAGPRVVEVSNQSVGYCPEPESWPAVAEALEMLGLPHPGRFTQPIVFRRCPACGTANIVKDDWFVCECGAALPAVWNCAPTALRE